MAVHRLRKTALAALAIGLLGGVMAAPVARDRSTREMVTLGRVVGLQAAEEEFGLRLLFRLRGERKPPPQVAIVATNEEFINGLDARSAEGAWGECIRTAQKNLAARRLPMRKEVKPWPRCMQARLIDALVARGAAVITFDIFFAARDSGAETPGDVSGSDVLAAAMKRAGKVVLMHGLYREVTCLGEKRDGSCDGKEIVTERQIAPDAMFVDAALGVGQFVLPSQEENFTRFWPFKGLADAPGLSAVALQAYADPTFASFARLIDIAGISWLTQTLSLAQQEAAKVGVAEAMRRLRIRLTALAGAQGEASARAAYAHLNRAIADPTHGLLGARAMALVGLLKLYRGASERYIDFYGPPCTLPIFQGDRILLGIANPLVEHAACAKHADSLGKEDPIAGKVVFVGVADLATAGIADHYTTVFTRQDGVGLSGVEIAATTFANLLTDQALRPVGAALALGIFLGFGGLVGALAYALPWGRGILATLVAGLAYGVVALMLFNDQDRWLPTIVPLFLQLPAAMLLGVSMQYLGAKRASEEAIRAREEAVRATEEARRKLEAAIKALGFYVPTAMAEALARGEVPAVLTEDVFGTVLTTDVEGFTPLSERTEQPELTPTLNRYYGRLTKPVERLGGVLASFSAGDRMMCAWPRLDPEQREIACRAALEVSAEAEDFNEQRKVEGKPELPTRIGLHAGRFSIGNVGGGSRYGFSFTGDTANGAERVEGLNKELRTRRVLASAVVVEGLDATFVLRRIGTFEPRGMHEVPIFEIMGLRDPSLPDPVALSEQYNCAIAEYESGRWPEAARLFEALLATWPEDDPAQYFLRRAREFAINPPSGDRPWVVRLNEK